MEELFLSEMSGGGKELRRYLMKLILHLRHVIKLSIAQWVSRWTLGPICDIHLICPPMVSKYPQIPAKPSHGSRFFILAL